MKKNRLFALLSITVVLVFITSLFTTVNVLADDSTPPVPTDVPVVTDVPTQEPEVQQDAYVADALAQVPEDTEIVVINEEGEILPLASEEASEIIADADPMWCPSAETTVTANCVNAATVTLLLPLLASKDEDGVIYFYTPATYNTNDVTFDGTNTDIDQLADNNLTLQGGWNGTTTLGSLISFSGNSVFSVPVGVNNWSGNITINNFTVDTAPGTGININFVAGDVTLNNDTVTNSSVNGASIDNTDGTGMISINDSTFNGNNSGGLQVFSNGDMVLNNVTVDGNASNGAILNNSTGSGEITLTGTNTFSNNDGGGLTVLSTGEMFLEDVTANGNSGDGIYLENCGCIDAGITLVDVIANSNGGTGTEILSSGGPVSVRNSHFEDNNYDGLNIENTNTGNSIASGNVTLIDVVASSNNWDDDGYANAYILTYGGDVTIINSVFTYNYHTDQTTEWGGDGLDVFSDAGGPSGDSGEINLLGVIASYNYNVGADLENDSCGCSPTTSGIFIESSSFDHNGDFNISNSDSRGLIAYSNGDITLTNVTANANGGGGAELDNTSGFGSITLNGSNVFNNNGYSLYPSVGLYAISSSDITLSGVTANGNGLGFGGGAFVGSGGNVFITNSNFNSNCLYCEMAVGFAVIADGDITLNSVTANNNGNDPLYGYTGLSLAYGALAFSNSGNVFVTNSSFNNNCTLGDCEGGGIQVLAFGNIFFDHVNANGNGIMDGGGADTESFMGNIDIYCSSFSNNAGYGLTADMLSGGVLTLNGVTITGNAAGDDVNLYTGSIVTNDFNCKTKRTVPPVPGLPLNIVTTPGSQTVSLDCASFRGTELVLPNGDKALFACPLQDSGRLDIQASDALPGELPKGDTFASGFTVHLITDGKEQTISDPAVQISFKIPEDLKDANLEILFWDGTKWVEVDGVNNGIGYFEASVQSMGTYLLVSK